MKTFAEIVIDITEQRTNEIAEQWCNAIRQNVRTPSYRSLPKKELVQHARDFYKGLRRIYYSAKPYTEVRDYFIRYAEDRVREGIPLDEAAYALMMMRRHMWLYANFEGLFHKDYDPNQAVEAINKTIRIFDHGIHILIKKYEEVRNQ